MKITDVTLESYEWPRPRPIRNGMFVYYDVRLDIVTVHTDDGLKGVGLGSGGAGASALKFLAGPLDSLGVLEERL